MALKGRDYLVGLKSGSPTTTTLIRAARNTQLAYADEQVDVTQKDSNGWKEHLQDAGNKQLTVTMDGAFERQAAFATLSAAAAAGTFVSLVVSDAVTTGSPEAASGEEWSGTFQITQMNRAGTFNGEQTYSFTFVSSGVVTHTPAA